MVFDPDALPVPDLGLACKDCGYTLAGLAQHRCPECGRAFTLDEYIPDGVFPSLIAGGKEVRALPAVVELLERYRIPFLETSNAADLGNMLGIAGLASERTRRHRPIAVARDRYFEAVDLIRRLELNEPLPPEPEIDDAPDEEWVCPSCGEANPGNFGSCWQCDADRPV